VQRERRPVAITAQAHLGDEEIVTANQRADRAGPAQRLGMPGVPALAVDDDGVEAVELSMLAEKTLTIEIPRREVPDAHARS